LPAETRRGQPTRRRVWEGCALPGRMFIPSVRGAAAWMANVNIGPRSVGKPGFPIPQWTRAGGPRTQAPTRRRVWEGAALPKTTLCSLRCCATEPHGGLR